MAVEALLTSGVDGTEIVAGVGALAIGAALLSGGNKQEDVIERDVIQTYNNGVYYGDLFNGEFTDGTIKYFTGKTLKMEWGGRHLINGWGVFYKKGFFTMHDNFVMIQREGENSLNGCWLKKRGGHTIRFENGDRYEGNIYYTNYTRGCYRTQEGVYMEGLWNSTDLTDGTVSCPEYLQFKGTFTNWKRQGKVKTIWSSDETCLTGNYQQGRREGEVTIRFSDDTEFTATYQEGLMTSPVYRKSKKEKITIDLSSPGANVSLLKEEKDIEKLSRIFITLWEDQLNAQQNDKAQLLLSQIRNMVRGLKIEKDYTDRSLRYLRPERYPFIHFNPFDKQTTNIMVNNLKRGYETRDTQALYNQLRYYYIASQQLKHIPNPGLKKYPGLAEALGDLSLLSQEEYFNILAILDQNQGTFGSTPDASCRKVYNSIRTINSSITEENTWWENLELECMIIPKADAEVLVTAIKLEFEEKQEMEPMRKDFEKLVDEEKWEKVIESGNKILDTERWATHFEPDVVYLYLAHAYVKKEQYSEALEYLDQIDAEKTRIKGYNLYLIYYYLTLCNFKLGHEEQIKAPCEKAIFLHMNNPRIKDKESLENLIKLKKTLLYNEGAAFYNQAAKLFTDAYDFTDFEDHIRKLTMANETFIKAKNAFNNSGMLDNIPECDYRIATCNYNLEFYRKKEESATETSVAEEKPDEAARYPGGINSLIHYIGSNIHYARKPQENGIAGKVYVSFIVDKEGKTNQVKLLTSLEPELNEIALNIIREIPEQWTPAMKDGKPVVCSFTVPINFILED